MGFPCFYLELHFIPNEDDKISFENHCRTEVLSEDFFFYVHNRTLMLLYITFFCEVKLFFHQGLYTV